MRRYGRNLECPICGIRHWKYPLKCITDVNRGYNKKTFIRYAAETITAFRDYCFNMGFTIEPDHSVVFTNPVRNPGRNYAEDFYTSREEENNKEFFILPKEFFTI